MTYTQWPYNLPIWRNSLQLDSPDGRMWARITDAVEVSMGNPTTGTLETSTGLQFEHCNPGFIWSEDSRYLAVPQYSYSRFWGFGKQRLLIIDVTINMQWQSKKIAHYIQTISFEHDEITIEVNPFKNPTTMKYKIAEIKEELKASPALPHKRV